MFVVYTPEGRSFIGTAKGLPALKVDPAKAVTPSKKAGLEDRHLEPDFSNPQFQPQPALNQYRSVQDEDKTRHPVTKVDEIMSAPVVTVSPDALIETAWGLMEEHRIHHLPVYAGGVLAGLCTRSDLLQRLILDEEGRIEEVREEPVSRIMHRDVVTARPDTDIRQVAMALSEYQISALPIISEEEKLVGIVTLSDLVERLSQHPPVEIYV